MTGGTAGIARGRHRVQPRGLAAAARVSLSGTACRLVRGKIEIAFDDLGERELKNIPDHVRQAATHALVAATP